MDRLDASTVFLTSEDKMFVDNYHKIKAGYASEIYYAGVVMVRSSEYMKLIRERELYKRRCAQLMEGKENDA